MNRSPSFLLFIFAVVFYFNSEYFSRWFRKILNLRSGLPDKTTLKIAPQEQSTESQSTESQSTESQSTDSVEQLSALPVQLQPDPSEPSSPVISLRPLPYIEMAKPGIFNIEGRVLRLETKDDVAGFVDEIAAIENLQEIRLSGNTIAVEAAEALAAAFAKHTTIQTAILSDIFTGRRKDVIPPALAALCGALENQTNLLELDISDNAFGPVGVPAFAPLLISNRTLQILRINNNGLGPEGGCMLADALIKSQEERDKVDAPPTLKTLVCGRNRLENKAAIAFAKALLAYPTLTEVRMIQNGIRPEGLIALLESLKSLKSLEVLDFQDNTATVKAGRKIAEALPSWPNLRRINIGDCLLGSKAVTEIGAALKGRFDDLEILDLSFANANDDAILAIADSLGNKSKLTNLELNGNIMRPPTIQAVQDALEAIGKSSTLGTLEDNEEEEDEEEEEEEEEAEEDEDD